VPRPEFVHELDRANASRREPTTRVVDDGRTTLNGGHELRLELHYQKGLALSINGLVNRLNQMPQVLGDHDRLRVEADEQRHGLPAAEADEQRAVAVNPIVASELAAVALHHVDVVNALLG
jgi:hypothetical protein